jgi:thiosulfate dehydrogenase (quinone) large subunit
MKRASVTWLVLMQWILAFQWLHSGWGKWSGPGFMNNIGKTLSGFATNNPHGWYSEFLRNTAIPNAELFGNSIRAGEILVGIALVLAGVLLLTKKRLPQTATWVLLVALAGGLLMNINFYFAAGWSSPSTWGINIVMALVHIVLGLFYFTNRKGLAN